MFSTLANWLDYIWFGPGMEPVPHYGRSHMNPMHKRAIDRLIDEHEGGFVDHEDDRGGATKYGITLRTLMDWRGAPVSKSDVAALTREEAAEIYYELYIKPGRLDLLHHEWLFNAVFDMVINHGRKRGILILQKACCVVEDGILGPVTAATANGFDPQRLRDALRRERALFYARIVRNDPSQASFIVGWTKRAFEFV